MAAKYRIRAGFSFVVGLGQVLAGGEVVELEDDVASQHAHKLEPFEESAKTESKKGSKKSVEKTDKTNPDDSGNQDPALPAADGAEQPAADPE